MHDHVAAIVLAAGAGSRFGGSKTLASLHGKPMLQHVLDRVAEAGVGETVVVLGRDGDSVEHEIEWRNERKVRNPDPERGLSSSLQLAMASLAHGVEAALILLGDQPLVAVETIGALLDAPADAARPIVVPVYADDRGRNPVLLRRDAFALAKEATGDRGLGPVLAAHPALVLEVPVEGSNPDVDTPADLARAIEASWAARVRANRDQVERIREIPDGADFYAPVQSLFRADPTRRDDPVLDALLDLIRPGEIWLDVGAGAGRFALPIARALDESGGSVVALDSSPSMLEAFREVAEDYAIENVRTLELRWPPPDPSSLEADVALVAHVGYDIEEIGPFIDALEAASSRLCVAVWMDRAPATGADPFWPAVHAEARVALPALTDFVELLDARDRQPSVTRITIAARVFESRAVLEGFARRQLWTDPAGEKESRFQAALEALVAKVEGGWTVRDRPPNVIGIVTWSPPAH